MNIIEPFFIHKIVTGATRLTLPYWIHYFIIIYN